MHASMHAGLQQTPSMHAGLGGAQRTQVGSAGQRECKSVTFMLLGLAAATRHMQVSWRPVVHVCLIGGHD
jgi:hypothetical protein